MSIFFTVTLHPLIFGIKISGGELTLLPSTKITMVWVLQFASASGAQYIDRSNVRNGPPIGTTGVNWGRIAMLRRHFPEFYAEFVKNFPEVANYG